MSKKNLVLIGAPGAGKGTQSKKLCEHQSFVHVSTGDLLRAEVKKESDLGKEIQLVIQAGQLVSDDLVINLLKNNLDLTKNNYIFDGFPRTLAQAQTLDREILKGLEYVVVYLKLNTESLVERLTNRRVSPDGKNIYNLLTNPPKVAGVCDVTGEKLIQRKDDTEEVIRERMSVFEAALDPMQEFYVRKQIWHEIDADRSMEEIYNEIINLL